MSWTPTGNLKGPPGTSGSLMPAGRGLTPLLLDQDYIDVVFASPLETADWILIECFVRRNTPDDETLNLWPTFVTDKTMSGFKVQLNGLPKSNDYFLQWAISGVELVAATSYLFFGPSSGDVNVASLPFTVSLPLGSTIAAPVTVILSDSASSGSAGTFTPASVTLSASVPSATFTYTPASVGSKTISVTNDGGLSDPADLVYTSNAVLLNDGDAIAVWPDSSGNGHDGAQSVALKRATFYKSGAVRAVKFLSASSQGFDLVTPISGAGARTCFLVFVPASPAVNFVALAGNANFPALGFYYGAGAAIYFGDRAGFSATTYGGFETAFHIVTLTLNGSGAAASFIDGSPGSVSAITANVTTGDLTAIGYRPSDGIYADGFLREMVLCSSLLATTDRQNVEKTLGIKCGISIPAGSTIDIATLPTLQAWWEADALG